MSPQAVWGEAQIAPEIADKAHPIHEFTRYPENARQHTERNIGLIQQSLRAHGQRTVLVVQKSTGYIVKGNGTHEAAEKLGWQQLAFDVQEMDDAQAAAYALADNKASDEAKYDRKKLIAALEKMVEGPGLNSSLWEIDELEDLVAEEDAVPVADVSAFTGDYNESEESLAARKAQAGKEGEKRREIPLTFTLADHAQFVGWLKALQKAWGVSGTMATVFAAVKRQAEAEAAGTVALSGTPLTEDVRVAERRAALREFRDLIITLGGERDYRGTWVLGQLQAMMAAQADSSPVSDSGVTSPSEQEQSEPEQIVMTEPASEAVEAALLDVGVVGDKEAAGQLGAFDEQLEG